MAFVVRAKEGVASSVREVLASRPHLRECLSENVVNYSALARALLKDVRKKNPNASLSAVKMALIRIKNEISESESSLKKKLREVLSKSVLQVQSDLVIVTIKRHALLSRIQHVTKALNSARFLQVLQGINTFTLIISEEDSEEILELVEKEHIVEVLRDQAALIIISPREIVETPGIIAFVTSLLYENNINISQIVSCHNETIIFVSSSEVTKAFQVVDQIIRSMKTQSSI
ncbi:MAG: ACT domain-containing protein [Acidilobaceae archaeon]